MSNKEIKPIIKYLAFIQALQSMGYNKEAKFIFKWFMSHGVEYVENEELEDTNPFNNNNYIDSLSYDLTEAFNCGYPCFTCQDAMITILKPVYGVYDLINISFEGVQKLIDYQETTNPNFYYEFVDFNKALEFLKPILTLKLEGLTVPELNDFFNEWRTYNNHPKSLYVFEVNEDIFINYNLDNTTYYKIDLMELHHHIKAFVDSLTLEDMELILGVIL